jgi:hypothetical protein
MPAILASIGGVKGGFHSRDFKIVDPEMLYVTSGQLLALTVIDLLAGGADRAKRIKERFTPRFTRESYRSFWAEILGQAEHCK